MKWGGRLTWRRYHGLSLRMRTVQAAMRLIATKSAKSAHAANVAGWGALAEFHSRALEIVDTMPERHSS
jgi:hypothetical protein